MDLALRWRFASNDIYGPPKSRFENLCTLDSKKQPHGFTYRGLTTNIAYTKGGFQNVWVVPGLRNPVSRRSLESDVPPPISTHLVA